MQISPEQGAFMSLLAMMLGVKKAIDIGVFTGYSSLRCEPLYSAHLVKGNGRRIFGLD